MRKSRLDKLICKDEKREPDYSLLDNAMRQLDVDGARKKSGAKTFSWARITAILAPICCVLLIAVSLVVFYKPLKVGEGIPPVLDVPDEPDDDKYYSATYDDCYNIDSVGDYAEQRGLPLLFFRQEDVYRVSQKTEDIEETDIAYYYPNKNNEDFLIYQRLLLKQAYEEVILYIQLQEMNDHFQGALNRFENLEQECVIGGVTIHYESYFVDDLTSLFNNYYYLYYTRVYFEYDGYIYRIDIALEEEEQWRDFVELLLK